MLFAHMSEEPPAASASNPAAAPLDDVIRAAMAKDPQERPASAGALGRAAVAAVDGGEGPAPDVTRLSPPARRGPGPRRPEGDGGRKIPLGIVLSVVAVIVLAAAALAALGVFSGDDNADKAATTTSKGAEPVARVLATIDVGDVPDGVATNKGTVFVTNAGDGPCPASTPWGARARRAAPGRHGAARPRGPQGRRLGGRAGRQQGRALRCQQRPAGAGRDDPGQVVTAGPVDRTAVVWVANTATARSAASTAPRPRSSATRSPWAATPRRCSWAARASGSPVPEDDTLIRIDAATAEQVGEPIPVGNKPDAVVEVGAGSVWVQQPGDDRSPAPRRRDRQAAGRRRSKSATTRGTCEGASTRSGRERR